MNHNHAAEPVLPDTRPFTPSDAGLPGRRTHWRRQEDDRVAEIVGIPSFTGRIVAVEVDGPLAMMVTNDGREVIIHKDHIEWPRAVGSCGRKPGIASRMEVEYV